MQFHITPEVILHAVVLAIFFRLGRRLFHHYIAPRIFKGDPPR